MNLLQHGRKWALTASGILLISTCTQQQRVFAGTIRHDRADASYTSLATSYPAVGSLTWGTHICSATLIKENWILTAGHCLDAVGFNPSDWTFDLTDSGGGVHVGAEIILHPGWSGDLTTGTDIALLRLATNETTITPATLNTNTSEVGQTVTHVGYGVTGNGVTGITAPAGTKRAGNNVIDLDGSLVSGYSSDIIFEDFDSGSGGDNWSGTSTQLDLEYLIAGGDSGGAVFANFGSGEVLTGVHSFIAAVDGNLDADYGDIAGSIKVSSYASWITSNIAGPDPVAPELTSWMIWSFFAMGLAVIRRPNLRRLTNISSGNLELPA
ncbi:S1 family peptidase [Stieleria sp. JC731]|uniref:S1 family peptidase n=1 Tax=Pirellulaceae TaxID=2691357 RepID=UPI001E5E08C4|nr:S1 family peptidase [Stieleria sp. JC731]MCC9599503.1 S1 family peptidase [Stieleria sp. JC731]